MIHSRYGPLLAVPAILFFLVGCDDADLAAGAPSVRDSAGITIFEHAGVPADLPHWTIAEQADLRLGARDGDRPDVFGRIMGAALRADSGVVVADALTSEIKAFDGSGVHLWTAGSAGGGPGEFSGQVLGAYVLPGDSVLVVHGGGRNAPLFDPAGRYARTISLVAFGIPDLPEGVRAPPSPVSVLGALADGTIVGTPGAPMPTPLTPSQPGRPTYQVAYYDRAGQVRDTVGTFPLRELVEHEGRATMAGLGSSSVVAVGTEQFVVGLQDSFEIRAFGPDASLTSILRVDVPAREIDDRVRACHVEAGLANATTAQARTRIRQRRETAPLAATLPAFGQMRIDAADRIWVQESVHPCESRQPRWWILDADGAWLAETSIPEGFRTFHIGADYLMGIVQDEYDVQYVERRRIDVPSADAPRPEAPAEASLTTQGHAAEQEACVAIRASEINAVDAMSLVKGAALWTRGSYARPLHQVSGARFLPDGNAVVMSGLGRELWIYDAATGDAVTQVGRSGDGPGEFRQAFDMNLLDEGRIAVLDRRNRRVVIFSPSGEPLETRTFLDLQGTFEGVMPDGTFLVGRSGSPRLPVETPADRAVLQDTDHVLLAVGQELREDTVRTWIIRRVTSAGQRRAIPFQPLTANHVVGQRVAWVEPTGHAVHTRSFAPMARQCFRWDGPATRISQAMRDSLLQDVADRAAARTDGGAWGQTQRALLEAMFAQDLLPPALPPFKSVAPAPDGTLWITLGVPMTGVDTARPTAIQVSASGTVLRRVSLPHRSSIWTAGQDRLLVGWYGADMEDWIGVFLLTPP
jgi:hypothetical protein